MKEILYHVINGVEIKILNYKCDYVGIKRAKATGYYYIGDDVYITYKGGSVGKKVGTDCKLILLPLSNFIDINGESMNNLNCDLLTQIEIQELSDKARNYHHLSVLSYEICLENHVDIFSFIDNGLAIDINTIK